MQKDTEASLRKDWNDLFDRMVAFGRSQGQRDLTQQISKVVREAQSATELSVHEAPPKRKTKPKKRAGVKSNVTRVLKDNADASPPRGLSPPEIRDYAKRHMKQELRIESIRQALFRMRDDGEAHRIGRGWHYGPKPRQTEDGRKSVGGYKTVDAVGSDANEMNETEAASNESSVSLKRYSIPGGQNV